jgi:hypothetical protein
VIQDAGLCLLRGLIGVASRLIPSIGALRFECEHLACPHAIGRTRRRTWRVAESSFPSVVLRALTPKPNRQSIATEQEALRSGRRFRRPPLREWLQIPPRCGIGVVASPWQAGLTYCPLPQGVYTVLFGPARYLPAMSRSTGLAFAWASRSPTPAKLT